MKAAFRLPRKRCPRVYLCARSSQSTLALLPFPPTAPVPHLRHSLLPFAFRPPPSVLLISHSLSLSLYIYLPPSSLAHISFSPDIRGANFSSIFLLLIFLFYLSLSLSLSLSRHSSPPLLTPSPRCSFSRALSRRGVNSSLEHGQQDNACLLKTSF